MKLTITRTLGATVAMTAIVATGFAASAHADVPLLNGTYVSDGGSDEFSWTISSSCDAQACSGTVSSNQGWSVPATFTNGMWNFVVTKPDGFICDDGSYSPAYLSLSIEPVTLKGTVSTDSNAGCPGGALSNAPFKLRQVG